MSPGWLAFTIGTAIPVYLIQAENKKEEEPDEGEWLVEIIDRIWFKRRNRIWVVPGWLR